MGEAGLGWTRPTNTVQLYLYEITSAIANAEAPEEVVRIVIDRAADVIGSRSAVSYLLGSDGNFVLSAARGVDSGKSLPTLPLEADLPISRAIREARAVWVEEAGAGSEESRVHAVIGLPLFSGAGVIGGLSFSFAAPHTFHEEERAVWLTLANHTALAVERSRFAAGERAARNRFKVLAEATQRFNEADLDLQEILTTVAREVSSRLHGTSAIMLSAQKDDDAPVSEGILLPGRAIVPLRVRNGTIGALTLSRSAELPPLNEDDLALLQELAERAAFVIQHAQLFEAERAARARAEELQSRVEHARTIAEQAALAREELLAIVSHDLRNPLAAIKTSAFMLNRCLGTQLHVPEQRARVVRHSETIQRSALRMERMIGDLLDYSQIQAKAFAVTLTPTNVARLLDDASDLQPLALERGQELVIAPAPVGVHVLCERDRIAQVLSNLVGNAVKFSPERGRIEVAITVSLEFVEFSVLDSGPGIPPEQLDQVFTKFWHREKSRNGGSGLGLFIARGIVEAHGGTLVVHNAPQGGACFSFTLRRA